MIGGNDLDADLTNFGIRARAVVAAVVFLLALWVGWFPLLTIAIRRRAAALHRLSSLHPRAARRAAPSPRAGAVGEHWRRIPAHWGMPCRHCRLFGRQLRGHVVRPTWTDEGPR
jgi:hypothetical protein